MANEALARKLQREHRYVKPAEPGDDDLGPLMLLPGKWKTQDRGWNMIALPFDTNDRRNFRVLMNQYREELNFTLVDKGVPNRGIGRENGEVVENDQRLVTLDYEQVIHQIRVDEDPPSDGQAGKECEIGDPNEKCLAIHHEPGLWLYITNFNTDDIDIARLATVPHGNSVLALGTADSKKGPPEIPDLNGLPIGGPDGGDINHGYLASYKKFEDEPFKGTLNGVDTFPGFFPTNLNRILQFVHEINGPKVLKTTILHVDTTLDKAGIVNIPFIERQADATEMKSTFWIQELDEQDKHGNQKLRLQYSQLIFLDFFERPDGSTNPDGSPRLIRWPHVSINTLDKVFDGPVA